MSLLLQAMEEPLDPGYAAAARDRAEGRRPSGGARRAVPLLAALVAGVVVTAAVQQLRAPTPSDQPTRELLQQEVVVRTERLAALERRSAALRGEIAAAQERADGAGQDPLEPLGRVVGELPLAGAGVELVVDDAPPLADGSPGEAVTDRDLQYLVNALWAAGAEGVSVDGQRLTSLTAIRSAGEAVLVGFRPLSPPYEVRAVGDPVDLQARFVSGPGGTYAAELRERYGLQLSLSRVDELRLPAAAGLDLRYAEPVGEAEAAPSAAGAGLGSARVDDTDGAGAGEGTSPRGAVPGEGSP